MAEGFSSSNSSNLKASLGLNKTATNPMKRSSAEKDNTIKIINGAGDELELSTGNLSEKQADKKLKKGDFSFLSLTASGFKKAKKWVKETENKLNDSRYDESLMIKSEYTAVKLEETLTKKYLIAAEKRVGQLLSVG